MKSFILKAIRSFLVKGIGLKNIESAILILSRLGSIDLLILSYHSRGILKYWNSHVSGEDFVVNNILEKYIKKENLIFFDVGANIGDYSLKIKEKFPHAKIYAFEPNPKTFELLNETMASLNISCHNLGLSSKSLSQKIYTYANEISSQHASVYKDVLVDLHKANNVVELEFKNTTLDEFCETHKIDYIDFIKIDTEGHELEVLKGAKKMIYGNRIGIIQFEFNEMNVISRVFLKDFYSFLENYCIYRLNSDKLIPLFEYDSLNEIFKFQNFLAINKKITN